MSKLIWQDNYSVGVAEFDRQHMRMFALINGFRQAIEAQVEERHLLELLDELAEYGQTHLAAEEAAFTRYAYPKEAEHKAVHDHYREKIAWFKERAGEPHLSFEILGFLENWWLGHILSADKEYAPFFADKGVK